MAQGIDNSVRKSMQMELADLQSEHGRRKKKVVQENESELNNLKDHYQEKELSSKIKAKQRLIISAKDNRNMQQQRRKIVKPNIKTTTKKMNNFDKIRILV